jgi:hypothetical protein
VDGADHVLMGGMAHHGVRVVLPKEPISAVIVGRDEADLVLEDKRTGEIVASQPVI